MKKAVSLILAFVMLFALVSCGQKDNTPQVTPQPSESQTPANTEPTPAETDYTKTAGNFRILTAASGTIYDMVMAGAVAITNDRLPNMTISASTSNGGQENVYLMDEGEAEAICLNANIAYWALNGIEPFDQKFEFYHLLTTHYNQTFFLTREGTGIKTVEDLKGKRIAVGPNGSGNANNAKDMLLGGYGLWEDNCEILYLSNADGADALKDGTIDAIVGYCSSNIAPSYITELDLSCKDLVYLGISEEALAKMQETMPYTGKSYIECETLTQIPQHFLAPASMSNCAVSPYVPEDVVYAFTKTLFDNIGELGAYHANGAKINTDTMCLGVFDGYKVHPGVAKYLKEVGKWDDSWEIGEVKTK